MSDETETVIFRVARLLQPPNMRSIVQSAIENNIDVNKVNYEFEMFGKTAATLLVYDENMSQANYRRLLLHILKTPPIKVICNDVPDYRGCVRAGRDTVIYQDDPQHRGATCRIFSRVRKLFVAILLDKPDSKLRMTGIDSITTASSIFTLPTTLPEFSRL